MREIGPHPLPVWPLEGAKFQISIANISVTDEDIGTVLSTLFTYFGSLYSAPGLEGVGPQIWASGSPNQNFTFFDPEIFCGV